MPTKTLIENKYNQYPKDNVNWKLIRCYGGISLKDVEREISKLQEYRLPIKIVVTYDSLYKLESIIEKYNFKIIIDESDQLVHYYKMKIENKMNVEDRVVINYVWELARKHIDRTSFITATPIPLKYIEQNITGFARYKFVWINSKPRIPYKLKTKSPQQDVTHNIIGAIKKNGYFHMNKKHKIKKLIIFLNSINSIKKMIESADLDVNEVAIICAEGTRNNNILKDSNILRLKDSNNLPTFTFVTSTGFQGIDLNDEEALSIVVSMVSKGHTMIDSNYDMKQAMSRNRNKNNQFYGTCLYIYNTTIFDKSEKEILLDLSNTRQRLERNIDTLQNDKEENKSFTLETFSSDDSFLQFTTKTNEAPEFEFEINENFFNAVKFALLETRRQFDDGFLFPNSEVQMYGENVNIEPIRSPLYSDYVSHYKKMINDKSLD